MKPTHPDQAGVGDRLLGHLELPRLGADGELHLERVSLKEFARALRTQPLPGYGTYRSGHGRADHWCLVLPEEASSGPGPREIQEALEPLLHHRKALPSLVFDLRRVRTMENGIFGWEDAQGRRLETADTCLLLAGDPADLPFALQESLSYSHTVGRLSFSRAEEYARYADRVVKAERCGASNAGELLAFAPAVDALTRYSGERVVKPALEAANRAGLKVTLLEGEGACRTTLLEAIGQVRPGIRPTLVVASHGGSGLDSRAPELGAFVDGKKRLVRSADIAALPVALPDGLAALLTCYSAGRKGVPPAPPFPGYDGAGDGIDQVSPVANGLLTHPRGALCVIGHVDPLLGPTVRMAEADSDEEPESFERLRRSLEALTGGARAAEALAGISIFATRRLRVLRATLEKQQRCQGSLSEEDDLKLVKHWIECNDAAGWVMLGDPMVQPFRPAEPAPVYRG